MTSFFSNLDTFTKGVMLGVVAYPVGKYIVVNFGSVLLSDAKTLWNKIAPVSLTLS